MPKSGTSGSVGGRGAKAPRPTRPPLWGGEQLEIKKLDPGLRKPEARMPGESVVAQIFALRKLGWGAQRIARETGVARNAVRDWI